MMSLFRELNSEEEREFRQRARENFKPGMEPDAVWHPVVLDEIRIMEDEAKNQSDVEFLTQE